MASFDENGKYIKTNWKAGDKITATKLNKIEESIEAVNDNDISRHVEADARLDALEAKDVAHDKEFINIKNTMADNKAAAELGDYEINSRMQFLEQELNEGIEEVHNVAETVDGKIATAVTNVNNVAETVDGKISQAETNMQNQVNQCKADIEAMTDRKNVLDYGAKGDGIFRSIREVFPNISLDEVKELNSSATLDNSSDWYVLQKVINLNENILIPSNKVYIIDLPIIVNSPSNIYAGDYNNRWETQAIIKNIGVGTSALILNATTQLSNIQINGVVSGLNTKDGIEINSSGCSIYNCTFDRNGGYGIRFNEIHCVVCFIDKCYICSNSKGGIYIKSNAASQNIMTKITNSYISNNGKNEDGSVPTYSHNWGDGVYVEGCIGLSLENTVIEANSGCGLYLTSTGDNSGVYGVKCSGNHFESNRNGNVFIDNTKGIMINTTINGNYYAFMGDKHEGSLIKKYDNNACIISNNHKVIDTNNFEGVSIDKFTLDAMRYNSSLKLGGELLNPKFPMMDCFIENYELADNYNCLRVDKNASAFVEYNDFLTFIRPYKTYKITVEYKYNKSTSTSANLYFHGLKSDKSTIVGNINYGITTGGDWREQSIIVKANALNSEARFLRCTMTLTGDIGDDYLLVRRIKINEVEDVTLLSGATSSRPERVPPGTMYYDTDLKKPIWGDWDTWRDANGTIV